MSGQQIVSGIGTVHPINGFTDDLHLGVIRQQIVPVSIGQLETGINDSVYYHDAYDGRMVFLLVDMAHPMQMAPVIRPSFYNQGDMEPTTAQTPWQTVDVASGYPPQTLQTPQGQGALLAPVSPLEGWITQ